jgi:hypothetical protein
MARTRNRGDVFAALLIVLVTTFQGTHGAMPWALNRLDTVSAVADIHELMIAMDLHDDHLPGGEHASQHP